VTKLRLWLLGVTVVALLLVNVYQNEVIAKQRHELVTQLQTLTKSQMQQGSMVQQMNEMNQKLITTAKDCKK
jgi:hypothetical protein